MKRLKMKSADLYHILIRSGAAYIVCLIVSILFLIDIHQSFEKRMEQRQPVLLGYAGALMDARIEGLERLLSQTAEEIGRIPGNDAAACRDILNRVCRLGEFEEAVYITDDAVYTTTGRVAADRYEQLERIREAGLEKVHTVQGIWEGYDQFLLFPVPVIRDNKEAGTLVAFYNCSDAMQDDIFRELRTQSACYLIESEGLILSFSDHPSLTINDSSYDNFYMQMFDLTQKDAVSKKSVQELRRNAQSVDGQSVSITTDHSENCLIATRRLKSMDGYLLACVTNMDEQNSIIYTFLKKTVVTLLILFALSAFSIFLIWRYVRGMTGKMEAVAYTDEITKGKNVNYFRREVMRLLEAHRETPYIIQRFDISNFRYLNEAYGHLRADDILRACVSIYGQIYTKKELCVRMDSDQFLTLTVNDNDVNERRERYIEAINEYALENGIKYPIRLKYGIYQLRKQDRDLDVMIDHANAARRSLSGDEKEYVAYYSDAIMHDMRKIDKIESEMQGALDTGEFKVFLQAKWDIVNDRVAGAEALVRWIKPEGSVVFPDEFIPVFEKNGFIEKLDFYMLENIMIRMRQVLDEGGVVYPVSINQSRILLHNPEYLDRIRQLFEKYAIPRQYIELEVTETALFDDRKHMIAVLSELKKEGVKLAMDDFGSGYSSLNTLKDMPFDILKIDKEFFSEAVTSDSSTLILQKIIEMADGLGMEVICEGVENKNQVEILRGIGCHRVQGYFYAKPVPADQYIQSFCEIPGVS